MATVTLAIGVATCAQFIAEYLGLIESASKNTAALRHEHLKSAISWFENAKYCSEETLMVDYLQDARREFMSAVSLEEYENKIAAILGLSMCQYLLGDECNANRNIQMINNVELSGWEVTKRSLKKTPRGIEEWALWGSQVGRMILRTRWMSEVETDFESYKEEILAINRRLISA